MKKIHKKARFAVSFLGGQSAIRGQEFWDQYVSDRIDNALMTEKERKKKDIDPVAIRNKALSVFNYFHHNGKELPIIGNWMLKSCWMDSAAKLGKTGKGGDIPGRTILDHVRFEPYAVFLYRNGKMIEKLDRLDLNTFKPRYSKTGLIKVRECIDPPARFEFDLIYDQTLLEQKHTDEILDFMQWQGLGPHRDKCGKFQYD